MSESATGYEGVSLYLATPVRGGTSPSYNRSARALEAWCQKEGIVFDRMEAAEAPIEVARDLLAASYLAATTPMGGPFSHCLMIDAGVGFKVETVRQMLDAKEDFVAAAVPLRQYNIEKAVQTGEMRDASMFAVQLTKETREKGTMRVEHKGGMPFAEIASIGGAMMLLKAKVFHRMFDSYPELRSRQRVAYFQPTLMTDEGESHVTLALKYRDLVKFKPEDFDACGEDISFGRRWCRLDTPEKPAKLWLLCDADLAHEGHGYFVGNFASQFG